VVVCDSNDLNKKKARSQTEIRKSVSKYYFERTVIALAANYFLTLIMS
jgi:hypothetical protein